MLSHIWCVKSHKTCVYDTFMCDYNTFMCDYHIKHVFTCVTHVKTCDTQGFTCVLHVQTCVSHGKTCDLHVFTCIINMLCIGMLKYFKIMQNITSFLMSNHVSTWKSIFRYHFVFISGYDTEIYLNLMFSSFQWLSIKPYFGPFRPSAKLKLRLRPPLAFGLGPKASLLRPSAGFLRPKASLLRPPSASISIDFDRFRGLRPGKQNREIIDFGPISAGKQISKPEKKIHFRPHFWPKRAEIGLKRPKKACFWAILA